MSASWYDENILSKQLHSVAFEALNYKDRFGDNDRSGYFYHGRDSEDWIIIALTSWDRALTTISVENGGEQRGLQKFKIFGSVDNVVFEEWIHIGDIEDGRTVEQHFHLDPASVYFAWSKGFRYFRLCSMENHGGSSTLFYKFGIHGVKMRTSYATELESSLNFVDALGVAKSGNIAVHRQIDSESCFEQPIELNANGHWVNAVVSRKMADEICIKWFDKDIMSYKWIQREDIPTKVRRSIDFIRKQSELTFMITSGDEDLSQSGKKPKQFTFEADDEFMIPLSDIVVHSSGVDNVCVYAKPKGKDLPFEMIKRIKCGIYLFSKFFVDETFHVGQRFEANPSVKSASSESGGNFEVVATSDIVVSRSGSVAVVCAGEDTNDLFQDVETSFLTNQGRLCLVSGGNVVNDGILSCRGPREDDTSSGIIFIDTDGVFVNKGTISCGDKGVVHIKCSEFKNFGVITPTPKVFYKKKAEIREVIKRVVAQQDIQKIDLSFVKHKGHYDEEHPRHLLEEGTDTHYDSDGNGKANEDWMIFRATTKESKFVTSISIRNYSDDPGIKKINIQVSTDGITFYEWLEIAHIDNDNRELQTFAVDPTKGYIVWQSRLTYFKINILENHGSSYNIFHEFRINGVGEQSD